MKGDQKLGPFPYKLSYICPLIQKKLPSLHKFLYYFIDNIDIIGHNMGNLYFIIIL